MPPIPMRPFCESQWVSSSLERQLEGSVGSHFTTIPAATGVPVSSSSGVTPTLPTLGQVKVTTSPAYVGSVMISS